MIQIFVYNISIKFPGKCKYYDGKSWYTIHIIHTNKDVHEKNRGKTFQDTCIDSSSVFWEYFF